MSDILDSIDRKFYSAIDGITTFENALRVGMSWIPLTSTSAVALSGQLNFYR